MKLAATTIGLNFGLQIKDSVKMRPSMLSEKGDAAELVLDGHLLGEHSSEVNLAELLNTARQEFNGSGTSAELQTVDETVLELEWPALRDQIAATVKEWHRLPACAASPQGEHVSPPSDRPVPSAPATKPPVPATNDPMRNNNQPYNANPIQPKSTAQPAWRRRCSEAVVRVKLQPIVGSQTEIPLIPLPRWRLNTL